MYLFIFRVEISNQWLEVSSCCPLVHCWASRTCALYVPLIPCPLWTWIASLSAFWSHACTSGISVITGSFFRSGSVVVSQCLFPASVLFAADLPSLYFFWLSYHWTFGVLFCVCSIWLIFILSLLVVDALWASAVGSLFSLSSPSLPLESFHPLCNSVFLCAD